MNDTQNKTIQILISLVIGFVWWKVCEYSLLLGIREGYRATLLFYSQAFGLIALYSMIFLLKGYLAPLKLGNAFTRKSLPPTIAIIVTVLIGSAYIYVTNQKLEPAFIPLLQGSFFGLIPTILTFLILSPIAEEVLFRGIIINPLSSNSIYYWFAATAISVAFSIYSTDLYVYKSSIIIYFIYLMIFYWARLVSGGILLPLLLHIGVATVGLVPYFF